jgi:SnoaL-like domain
MWNRLASVVLVVFCAAFSHAARAQAPSASGPRQLTALDYFEIQQLVAKYARAIDTCSNNGYDYADLFTPDGSFIPSFNGKPGAPIQGRERLAEVSGGGSRGCKNVGWIVQGVRHLYVNHIITPTADGATGVVDMLMIGLGGDPNKIEYDGYYEDTYVRTPLGWRFKQRMHHALLREGNRVTPPPAAK